MLLVLDRDGTLTPITPDPAKAIIEHQVIELLSRISRLPGISIAVLSARSLKHLTGDFNASEILLAGNYGLEIKGPGGITFLHPTAAAYKQQITTFRQEIEKAVAPETATILDDHDFSLCLHFHLTTQPLQPSLHNLMHNLSSHFQPLLVKRLPTSYEIMPPVEWNKGTAISKIISLLKNKPESLLFAGDSEADEPGFKLVNNVGGISIRIGPLGPTTATFKLEQPCDLIIFLNLLANSRQNGRRKNVRG